MSSSPPKDQSDALLQAKFILAETIARLSQAAATSPGFFPNGITKLEIEIKMPASTGLVLKLEGPDKPAGESTRHGYGDHAALAILLTTDPAGLGLKGPAKAGAESLSRQFGNIVVFTSGLRTVEGQCDAMATNIVNTQDRKWIARTYTQSNERDELQKWVDDNSQATSVQDLSGGLFSVMDPWGDDKRIRISLHLVGAAFDIQPIAGGDGQKVKEAIPKLAGFRKFLDGEAGVKVWHVQFVPA